MKRLTQFSLSVVVSLAGWCCLSANATHPGRHYVAYWRHEEGQPGALIPAGANTVLDSDDMGNHMQTFDPVFTSADYSSSVSPLALRDGLSNTRSLNFGPGGVDEDRFRGGRDDDNFTSGKPIETHRFDAMTVELAFNLDAVDGWQALLGKDGKPTDHLAPPFKVLVRNDSFPGPNEGGTGNPNQLFIEWIDGDGDLHYVASGESMTTGTWNHLAFVLTPTNAQMWLAGESTQYRLPHSSSTLSGDFAGADGRVLFDSQGTWSVGRGMFNGGITDWSDALIDEVRIADDALSPNEFLFAAIPEPHTGLLALMVLSGFACRRPGR